jgi:hypothetical protein
MVHDEIVKRGLCAVAHFVDELMLEAEPAAAAGDRDVRVR